MLFKKTQPEPTEASLLQAVCDAERKVWAAKHDLAFYRATDNLATWNHAMDNLLTAERQYAEAQQALKTFVKGETK